MIFCPIHGTEIKLESDPAYQTAIDNLMGAIQSSIEKYPENNPMEKFLMSLHDMVTRMEENNYGLLKNVCYCAYSYDENSK